MSQRNRLRRPGIDGRQRLRRATSCAQALRGLASNGAAFRQRRARTWCGSGLRRGRRRRGGIGWLLRPLAGDQLVDGAAQVGQPVLQFLKFVGNRPVVMVVGMIVAARTGRLGLLSAAWFAGTAAAVGERDDLLGVVAQGFGDLAVQRTVVVVEVPEESLETRSGHARTLAVLLRRRPRRQQGNGDERRHGACRSQWRNRTSASIRGEREKSFPLHGKAISLTASVWRSRLPVYYRERLSLIRYGRQPGSIGVDHGRNHSGGNAVRRRA